MNNSDKNWLIHLPKVKLKDYRDVQFELDGFLVVGLKFSFRAEFCWTNMPRINCGSLTFSNSDEAHAVVFVPEKACASMTQEETQSFARDIFDGAVSAFRNN